MFREIIYRVLGLSRFKQATINRFLSSVPAWITGRRLIIHTLKRSTWTWDRDDALLHASFQLLVDYIECELPDQWIDWNSDPDHARSWSEMGDLYRWWKVERPRRLTLDDLLKDVPQPSRIQTTMIDGKCVYTPDRERYPEYYSAMTEYTRIENDYYDEDQANLHRLVSVREYMWT